MIDAVDTGFWEYFADGIVDGTGRFEVVSDGFLDHHPGMLIQTFAGLQIVANIAEQTCRHGKIDNERTALSSGLPDLTPLLDVVVTLGMSKIEFPIIEAGKKALHDRLF